MMILNSNLKALLKYTLPFGLILSMVILAYYVPLESNPDYLSVAIILGLVLTSPLIYFLLIRKTTVPKVTVVPIFIIGVIVASYIIPEQNQYWLDQIKLWVIPIVELCVLIYVFFTFRKIIKNFKKNETGSVDFFTTLKTACNEIMPSRIAMLFTMEVAVFYYGFVHWKSVPTKENEFTYHKKTGTPSLLIALLFVILIEAFAIHFLLLKWSHTAAWILTGLSIYTSFQIFGFARSLSKRPTSIDGNYLNLRYGILGETKILIEDIDSIEVSSKKIEFDETTRAFSPLGDLEKHNIVLRLKKENTLIGPYGFTKQYRTLAFFIDDKEGFRKQVQDLLNVREA